MGVCQEGGTQHQVATTSRLLLRGVFWCKAFNCATFLLLLVHQQGKSWKWIVGDRVWAIVTVYDPFSLPTFLRSDHGVDDNEQDRQRDRGREKCVAIKGVVRDLLFGPVPLSCFALVAPLWWKALPAFPSNFQWGVNVKSDGWGNLVFVSKEKYSIYVVKISQIGGV